MLAAGLVNAADFVEKPETAFSDEWKVVQKVGTTGLECSTRDGVLTVTGLAGADTAKNGVSVWTLERKFAPVSGDFAAAVQFDWDVQDKAFMGEFLLEVVDEQGKVLAAAGFSDGWIAQQGVMRGCVGEPGKKIESVPGVRIPLRGRGVFGIDRVGGAYRFLWNGKSMKAQTGSDVPAAGVRLVFRFSRYAGNDKLPPSHFGDFAIREVSFRAKEAAKASFSEKPADGFSPAWRQGVTGARGLTCKADDGVLLVNGFAEEDNAKIAATEVTLERSVAPCPGDFTAALDMEYDTLDKPGDSNTGKCTINFGGTATLGVPRNMQQIADHPVTCYLFGAGKGDQRAHFSTWTNVNSVQVNVTGGIIYAYIDIDHMNELYANIAIILIYCNKLCLHSTGLKNINIVIYSYI